MHDPRPRRRSDSKRSPSGAGRHLRRRHLRPRRAQPRDPRAARARRAADRARSRPGRPTQAARAIADPRFAFFRTWFSRPRRGAGRRCASTACCSTSAFPRRSSTTRRAASRFARRAARHAHGPVPRACPRRSGCATAEEKEIREVIRGYGEERFAQPIAAAIVAARVREPLRGTRQLADLVAQAVRTREPGQDPATRTFQALRIHVNRELEEVSLTLPQAVAAPRPGRAPRGDQLPFARGPHRQALLAAARRARQLPRDCRCAPAKCHNRRSSLDRPGAARFCRRDKSNPRARSATLRVAERTAAPYVPNNRIEPDARWRN